MAAAIDFRAEAALEKTKDALIPRLHAEAPLHKDNGGFWVATRFEDVRAILLDHANFSSSAMGGFPLLGDDPPRHQTLRGLLAKGFTPARIEAMRPEIEALARDMASAIQKGKEVEIVGALTSPLPIAVIAGLMGVPEQDHSRFKKWSDALVGLMDDPSGGERMKTLMELSGYFNNMVAERRAAPRDDLISALARAEDQSVSLTDQEVVGFACLLLIAGNETTTNLLSSLLNRLAADPAGWAKLKSDPALIESAIEEALRMDAPAQFVMRVARENTRVGDVDIRAGDFVIVYLAGANRDPAKWSDPGNFELARMRERHVAFGHGVHHCIGAPLARLEAQAVMKALVARFEGVAPGSKAGTRLPSGLLSGFRTLPVVFS